jgi:hypothetical protein
MKAESYGSAKVGIEGTLQKALRFGKRALTSSLAGWRSHVGSDGPAHAGKVRNYEMSIHVFVISWDGKHDNAERIIKAVASQSNFVSVVYSDPDSTLSPVFSCPSIRRPNDLFFGDKFQACIDSCNADILLIICADCNCEGWSEVPERCRRAIEQISDIGVWAPLIDFTDWCLDRTEIDRIPNSPFSIVAQTDTIVFGLTRRIANRMREADLQANVYGWGIDSMFNSYTYSVGMISVVDRNVIVTHPSKTEYSFQAATIQQIDFLKQLTYAERTQSCLLDAVVRLRDIVEEAGTNESVVAEAKLELVQLSQRILGAKNLEGYVRSPARGFGGRTGDLA